MERREEEGRREGKRAMMLREKTGGRTVNGEVREREDGWGGKKKKKSQRGKGETWRTRQLPIDAGAFDSGVRRSADTGRWSQ